MSAAALRLGRVHTYLHVVLVADAALLGSALWDDLREVAGLLVSQELLEPLVQVRVLPATSRENREPFYYKSWPFGR